MLWPRFVNVLVCVFNVVTLQLFLGLSLLLIIQMMNFTYIDFSFLFFFFSWFFFFSFFPFFPLHYCHRYIYNIIFINVFVQENIE